MQEDQQAELLDQRPHRLEDRIVERPPAGRARQHAGAERIEVHGAPKLVGDVLRLAEREHHHRRHQAFRLRGELDLLGVQCPHPFAGGGAARPGEEARRRRKQLQLDLAAPQAFQAARQVVQVHIERGRAIPAPAAHEVGPVIAALGRDAGDRRPPQIGQEALAHRMRVNIDDHFQPPLAHVGRRCSHGRDRGDSHRPPGARSLSAGNSNRRGVVSFQLFIQSLGRPVAGSTWAP